MSSTGRREDNQAYIRMLVRLRPRPRPASRTRQYGCRATRLSIRWRRSLKSIDEVKRRVSPGLKARVPTLRS
jgi:hypothetical protein